MTSLSYNQVARKTTTWTHVQQNIAQENTIRTQHSKILTKMMPRSYEHRSTNHGTGTALRFIRKPAGHPIFTRRSSVDTDGGERRWHFGDSEITS